MKFFPYLVYTNDSKYHKGIRGQYQYHDYLNYPANCISRSMSACACTTVREEFRGEVIRFIDQKNSCCSYGCVTVNEVNQDYFIRNYGMSYSNA